MSRLPSPTSRREVLALALAGVLPVAVGCSTPPDAPAAGGAGPRSGRASDVGPAADGPDTVLVDDVVHEISRAFAQVRADRRAHPPLAARLRDLERLHARHAAELGGVQADAVSGVAAQRRQAQVVPGVKQLESRLQTQLVDASVAADSGALALLLAAMAAGLAQERTRL